MVTKYRKYYFHFDGNGTPIVMWVAQSIDVYTYMREGEILSGFGDLGGARMINAGKVTLCEVSEQLKTIDQIITTDKPNEREFFATSLSWKRDEDSTTERVIKVIEHIDPYPSKAILAEMEMAKVRLEKILDTLLEIEAEK